MNSAEVAAKLVRVRGWLAGSGYGAALFTTQPGVACVTGGLEDRVSGTRNPRWCGPWSPRPPRSFRSSPDVS